MKVFILSNDDLTSSIIFSPLLEDSRLQIVGVGISATVAGGRGWTRSAVRLLTRMSKCYWLFLVISNLSFRVQSLLRAMGLTRHSPMVPILRITARELGIPVYFRSNFNDASFLQLVRESCADVIVIRVNQILKSPLIDFPPKGVYCVHSSLLPAYRGIAGEFHAMWNRDSEIGSSLFRVELALDEGPVLRQFGFPIQYSRSVFSHMLENNRRAAELLRASLHELRETGKIEQHLPSLALAPSYFSWPTSERVREFRSRGGTLFRLRELLTILSPKFSSES